MPTFSPQDNEILVPCHPSLFHLLHSSVVSLNTHPPVVKNCSSFWGDSNRTGLWSCPWSQRCPVLSSFTSVANIKGHSWWEGSWEDHNPLAQPSRSNSTQRICPPQTFFRPLFLPHLTVTVLSAKLSPSP